MKNLRLPNVGQPGGGSVFAPLRDNPAFLMVCLTMGVIMLGQGVISPVLPLYAKDFAISASLVGASISVFGLARLLLNLPAGLLSDRVGRRVLLVSGPAITALASFLSAAAGDIWQLLAYRFIAGAGSAVFMTSAFTFVADIAAPENRGRMLSLLQGSLLIGVSVGPAVGGLTAELFGLRAPFVLVGFLAAGAALWALRTMPETSPAGAHPAGDGTEPPHAPPSLASLRPLFTNVGFVFVSLVTFSIFFTRTGGRMTVLPLLADERFGLSAGAIGAVFAMMALLNLAMIAPAGIWADRFGRKRVIVPSSLLAAGALGLFAVTGNLGLFIVAAVVQGIGTGLAGPAPAAYAADVTPPEARGLGMGLFRTYGDLGFVIGPPLLGWIVDSTDSFAWALGVNAVLLSTVVLAFALFARETVARPGVPQEPGVASGETT